MNLLKRNFIWSVVKELEVLNGTEFEYMCKDILSIAINKEVIHKGHNLFAKPVGYTRDFYEDSNTIVGQAGTDKDYFTNYNKPLDDALKCVDKSRHCKEIYLFSNMFCTGKQYDELCGKFKEDKRFSDKNINIYDAQRIGDLIFDNIEHNKINNILNYLPISFEIYKMLPNNNKLPKYKNVYFTRREEQDIIKQLSNIDCMQIYGLSGIGKTEITIKVAEEIKDNFDACIWINSDLQNANSINFTSIKLDNYGQFVNIEYFIEKYRMLIVIDNLNDNVNNIMEQFKNINKNKSKLIITSLQKDCKDTESFKLNGVENVVSKQILNESNTRPNSVQMDIIIEKVNGYPLVLNLIKNGINNNDFCWEDIIGDIDDIHSISDENNKKICNRLIGRYISSFNKELSALKYLNTTKIHMGFLKLLLSTIKISDLVRRNILNINNDYYTIHQLVMDSINELIEKNIYEESFDSILIIYLKNKNISKDIDYYTFIWTHNNLLSEKYNSLIILENKKIILYALIMSKDYLSETKEIIEKIKHIDLELNSYYDIAIYIEKCQLKLMIIKRENKDEYIVKSEEIINELLDIINKQGLDNASKVLIYHHIGKIFNWISKYDEAEKYLLLALEINNKFYQSMLQLARIYVNKNEINKCLEHFDTVLNDVEGANIPITIILSFYDLLNHKNCKELKEKYIYSDINKFIKILLRSLHSEFDQPYIIINKFSRDLSYNFPEQFNILCENLPYPRYIDENINISKAYAEIFSSYYNLVKYDNVNIEEKDEKLKEIFRISEKFFLQSNISRDYDRKLLMDLYIKTEEYEKAKKFAETYEVKNDPYYLQVLCKIERGIGNLKESLVLIDKAIEIGAEENIKKEHLSAFLHDKACTEYELNDAKCINTIQEAINIQENFKTINTWNQKLTQWKINMKVN